MDTPFPSPRSPACSSTLRASFKVGRRSHFPTAPLRSIRLFSSEADDILNAPREAMEYDVLIVGAGPAGLSAAIKLKQLGVASGKDLSVCIVEKAANVGDHILSGNVFEPRALNELIPDWKEKGAPLNTECKEDEFMFLTPTGGIKLPGFLIPPGMHNDGNYITSLGQVTRWLATQAEELGVEIYAGFSASEVLYNEKGAVTGIATRDVGIGKDGKPKDTFARGMELKARQTLFAEGARGSCSLAVEEKFGLRSAAKQNEPQLKGACPQVFGLGVKEVWTIPQEKHRAGYIQHTLGWPLQNTPLSDVYGGSFLYHMKPNLVLVGMVVGLDYQNPYLSPYEEFQRFKTHPAVARHLEGGEVVAYGARVINEGGFQAIPKLTFPGGALIGCSAGFLNVPKIKGTHTAMKSGMVAAEAVHAALTASENSVLAGTALSDCGDQVEVTDYQSGMEKSWVWKELKEVRNIKPSFHWGFLPGLIYSGIGTLFTKGAEPWSFFWNTKDCDTTKKAKDSTPINYPKPDGKLSFDILSSVARSGTNHNGDQPAHLRVKPELADVPDLSISQFAGPEQRFCPAKVYEYTDGSESADKKPKLVINAQNCVHCKCCSIKMPKEYINWTVPEGGGGPAYSQM
jgi:electron-transferring-flavoprotein dehydrogenase